MKQKEFKTCLRCGRKLKSLESKQRGYGDICAEKMRNDNKLPLFKIK